jgi:hypothetical protein
MKLRFAVLHGECADGAEKLGFFASCAAARAVIVVANVVMNAARSSVSLSEVDTNNAYAVSVTSRVRFFCRHPAGARTARSSEVIGGIAQADCRRASCWVARTALE